MLKSVFTKTLWEQRRSLIIWAVAISAYAFLIISLYPSFGNLDAYNELVKNAPPAFQALIGEIGNLGTVGGYLANEHFAHMYLILMTIFAVRFGGSIIATEEKNGTLELMLARPISRISFVIQKTAAMYVAVFLMSLANWFGIIIGPYLVDVSLDGVDVFGASVTGALVALVFGTFMLVVTSLQNTKALGSGLTIGAFVVSFFLNTFAQLVEWLEPYREFSVIYYYDIQNTLIDGADPLKISFIFVIGIIFVLLSLLFFNQRDIGT